MAEMGGGNFTLYLDFFLFILLCTLTYTACFLFHFLIFAFATLSSYIRREKVEIIIWKSLADLKRIFINNKFLRFVLAFVGFND